MRDVLIAFAFSAMATAAIVGILCLIGFIAVWP